MNNLLLKGKIAVITGSTGGLGSSIAIQFAKQGARLLCLYNKNMDRVGQLVSAINASKGDFHLFQGDLTNDDTIKNVYSTVIKKFGRCDILVNCAGIITRTVFEKCSYPEWSKVIDLNLNTPYKMCKLFLPLMRRQKYGKVINITSQMAFKAHEGASPSYEVSKAGLTALTRHLAMKYGKYNITVNSLAPGSFNTKLADTIPIKIKSKLNAGIPSCRLGDPLEASNAALFLASDQSSYINGTTLHVNGGSFCN